jgi:predicted adenine nucleotide alpha hydrolase (AANH) superfamily ATPase
MKKQIEIKTLKEKYKIALQIKDYERAKKFLRKIKELEGKNEKSN